ncbi:MAG: Mbov_0395 family pilin-like conjugal transfer protein [Clostridia bacterium]
MFLQMLETIVTWRDKIITAVNNLLPAILIIACSVGMIWAIVVGIKMMKADNKNDRDEAKAKLINIAISIVAIAVLIGLFYALMNWLKTAEGEDDAKKGFGIISNVNPLMNTFNLVAQCARMIVFKC